MGRFVNTRHHHLQTKATNNQSVWPMQDFELSFFGVNVSSGYAFAYLICESPGG